MFLSQVLNDSLGYCDHLLFGDRRLPILSSVEDMHDCDYTYPDGVYGSVTMAAGLSANQYVTQVGAGCYNLA